MKILIADDSNTTRNMLKLMISKFGHEYVEAVNGQQAIDVLMDPDGPKLALIDWIMPGIDGLEVCRRIKDADLAQSRYLIMLTARNDKTDLACALDAGANDYIVKPYDPVELRARIDAGARVVDAETKLTRAKNRMAEFVGIVSHDLRSPIGSVISALEILGEDPESFEEFRPLLTRSCEQALSIITDLLDLTALESSRIELNLSCSDLAVCVRDSISLCKNRADKKSVELIYEGPDELIARFDSSRLGQVLDNLISNAIKFTPMGKLVTVRCIPDTDQSVRLEVEDQGVGIEPHRVADLFMKEKKTSTKGTNGETGTGFGLPLAQEIVKLHGGDIRIESELGVYSRFSFHLSMHDCTE